VDGVQDMFWRQVDGTEMTDANWNDPGLFFLGVEMRMARGTPRYLPSFGALYIVFNAGKAVDLTLPDEPAGQKWQRVFETKSAERATHIAAASTVAFQLVETGAPEGGQDA
jgi:glycogen operon protein